MSIFSTFHLQLSIICSPALATAPKIRILHPFTFFSPMLDFFYDSLDTLKKVKKPTMAEVRVFTIQVFVTVIVASIIFFILDFLAGNFYQQIFQTFGG